MARLIPSFIDERAPPGERDVFNLLASGPDDWIALHSLDLAPWNRGLRTEVDFVIIVPDTGILCVEVKSQEDISFDGYRWHPKTITRSPFKQAADGRYTFYRRLKEIAPQFKKFPVVHCCIFPRSRFDLPPNLSVQAWELLDSRGFTGFQTGDEFAADLKKRMERSIAADAELESSPHSLSGKQVEAIVHACVPVQRRRPDARAEIVRREQEMEHLLRDQQKPVLRLASLNRRVVVSGGAGTGKTLIAVEVARRAAEAGKRTALLCYNQLVGEWMSHRAALIAPALPNLVAGRAIRVMAQMAGIQIPVSAGPHYWEEELPAQLEERLTDPDFHADAEFDYLVLDEAQDVLARESLWQCLGQFLSNGSGGGSFILFGDFENQVLAERAAMAAALEILDSLERPVRWELAENCRNYRIVGETAVRLSGIRRAVYSGYLRPGGGVTNYDIYFYSDQQEQRSVLEKWLKEFQAKGYSPSEITILSFRADKNSVAEQLKDAGHKLRPVWQQGGVTGYASVHAFKGMENKIIILTDVVLGDHEFQRDLFYTGMTRATESVRILCDRRSEETLLAWLS